MTIVFILLIASALLGLVTGLFFRVWAIALASVLIAIVSAVALRIYDFGFAAGVPVIVGCLAVSQTAYLAGAFILSPSNNTESLVQDEVDDHPSGHGQEDVSDHDE